MVSAVRRERPNVEDVQCPFCPGSAEVPDGNWDVLVLENKYPSLMRDPPPPDELGIPPYRMGESYGACLVIVLSPSHTTHLAGMPVAHVKKIVETWEGLYKEFSGDPKIRFVLIFENRGKEIGVTIEHPHCQVYAFPFVPPLIRREMESSRRYLAREGRCLFCDVIKAEISSGARVVFENESFVSFIPFAPKMPYGVAIYPKRHVPDLMGLTHEEELGLSESLKQVVTRLDGLFNREMAYSMVLHQQPTDRAASDYYHLHVEFYPKYRERDKLKFLAGVELGAGTMTYDYAPEEKAAELREVSVR